MSAPCPAAPIMLVSRVMNALFRTCCSIPHSVVWSFRSARGVLSFHRERTPHMTASFRRPCGPGGHFARGIPRQDIAAGI